jgi:hypothetical protein
MDAIMTGNASAKIRHNDQVSIGAAGIEDTYISSAVPAYNYGGLVSYFQIYSTPRTGLIRVLNVDDALGADATISASVCSLYTLAVTSSCNGSGYRVLKPWGEGTSSGADVNDGSATWDDWACDASEWGAAGCANASDAGADNSSDGSGYDRWATAEGTTTFAAVSNWYTITISSVLAQGWYNLSYNENGIAIVYVSGGLVQFACTEYTTDTTKRPRFSFTYTTGGAPAAASIGQIIFTEE